MQLLLFLISSNHIVESSIEEPLRDTIGKSLCDDEGTLFLQCTLFCYIRQHIKYRIGTLIVSKGNNTF